LWNLKFLDNRLLILETAITGFRTGNSGFRTGNWVPSSRLTCLPLCLCHQAV